MTYMDTICKYVNSIEITPDRIDKISEEAFSDHIEIELLPISVSRRDISSLMANERPSYYGWHEQCPPSRHFVDYSRVPSNRMDSNGSRLLGLSAKFVVDEETALRLMDAKGSHTPPTAKYRQFVDLIEKVIFQDGATVILWKNGDKTVVKAQEGEPVDYEKGFAMAIAKYFFGNEGNYYEAFKKFLPEETVEEKGKPAYAIMDDMWIKRLERDIEELRFKLVFWAPGSEEYVKISNELVEAEKMLDTLKGEEEK